MGKIYEKPQRCMYVCMEVLIYVAFAINDKSEYS